MSGYVVTQAGRDGREPFANYIFDVWQGGCKVAELSHDYRGDEYWVRAPGAQWTGLPERVLIGRGPEPLRLSSAGVQVLDRLLA